MLCRNSSNVSTSVYFDIKNWNIYRDVIYLIIIIFTSTVNILVIITIKQIKNQKTLKNDFLMNIACTDLLIALICIPTNYIIQGISITTLSVPLCKLIAFIQETLICCSVWSLLVASIDRYVAFIKWPKPSFYQCAEIMGGEVSDVLIFYLESNAIRAIGPKYWVITTPNHLFWSFLLIYYLLLIFLGIEKSLTGNSQWIVWAYLTILWSWRLQG